MEATNDESLERLSSMEDVPDEVLEFILGFLPPYQDLQNCMCVCKRWYHCSQSVKRNTSKNFVKAITEFKVLWKKEPLLESLPIITKRFCHAACITDNSMFIFGGCTTNTTAFNDLWRFDLSIRKWVRPMATGTYPVPKAYTTMSAYEDNLVLFGGYTYPSPSPYYQNDTMFNDVHFYNIPDNKWTLITTENGPPPTAGHSACVRGQELIIFGGLVAIYLDQVICTNDVWVLNLQTLTWRKQATTRPQPHPRYAQSLILLDDERFMLLGGSQTFQNRFVYNDCWVLTMKGPVWTWEEIPVKNKEWSAANIWCNPACRVGDKVVSLSRCKEGWNTAKPLVTSALRLNALLPREEAPLEVRVQQNMRKPLDRDQNVNGKRGILPRQPVPNKRQNDDKIAVASTSKNNSQNDKQPNEIDKAPAENSLELGNKIKIKFNNAKIVKQLQEANKYRMAAFACDPVPESDVNLQRRLNRNEPIRRPEQPPAPPVVKKIKRNTLTIHVLDISNLLNENSLKHISWLCPRLGEMDGAPEELVMYSLVRGNGELIMFGGVHNDINEFQSYSAHQTLYSNAVHSITFPRDII